jgi:nitroreductase
MDVFETMETCRAMRWFTTDPVSDEMVEKLIWAATRAPSPGNSQHYGFVVVRDRAKLRAIGDAVSAGLSRAKAVPPPNDPSQRAMLEGTFHLAEHLDEVPVLIVVGGLSGYPPGRPNEHFVWSALYPAVQNLVLAARALGLGTTLTTWHLIAGPTIRAELSVPDDVHLGAVIPVGWPARPFGPVRRRPAEDFVHHDVW